MIKAKQKKKKRDSVFAAVRKNPRWILLPFFLFLAGVYLYHWVTLVQNTEEEEDVIKQEEISYSEDYELLPTEEDDFLDAQEQESVPQILNVSEHMVSLPDTMTLPDMQQVMHTSRLLFLENSDDKANISSFLKENTQDKKEQIVPVSQSAKIAIVIDDMGASPKRSRQISDIKAPITASFVTFASRLPQQIEYSKASGQEIMIHVPMQPKSNVFVSDDVLSVDMTEEQITKAFEKMLGKFKNVKGVNNHMGSKFTEHGDKLAPVMKLLAQHHLFFLDSKTTPRSVAENIAHQHHVPYVKRDVFLDNEDNLEYILRQLEKMEKIARQNGYAIAIGHPKTQTVQALKVWLKTLKEKQIELVPLSALVFSTVQSN